jgi:phosphonate transport system substrate-binding protein
MDLAGAVHVIEGFSMTSNLRRSMEVGLAFVALAAALLASACLGGDADGSVRLDDRAKVAPVDMPPQATPADGTLRIAIAGVMSPSRTLDAYDQLLGYLQDRLGVKVTVEQRASYAEVNDLLRTGQVDVAFVCSRAYLEGQEQFGMNLLLAPQVNGDVVYYSYLIVPSGSGARSLAELRGKRFAFSDPLSNTGRLAPEYELHLAGETPNAFFASHEYTGSHDNSILAVADGLADGAAVDSLVYEYIVARTPEIGRRTKIIAKWGPYGIPPLVTSPSLSPDLREKVRTALLEMDQSDEGRTALAALGVDRFVTIDDHAYDSIRDMMATLREAGR